MWSQEIKEIRKLLQIRANVWVTGTQMHVIKNNVNNVLNLAAGRAKPALAPHDRRGANRQRNNQHSKFGLGATCAPRTGGSSMTRLWVLVVALSVCAPSVVRGGGRVCFARGEIVAVCVIF